MKSIIHSAKPNIILALFFLLLTSVSGQELASAKTMDAVFIKKQSPAKETLSIPGFKNKSIQDIFNYIEKNSPFRFVFNSEILKDLPIISLTESSYELFDLLNKISEQTPLQFKRIASLISVAKSTAPDPEENFYQVSILPEPPKPPTVSGKVLDSKTGEAVIGANVLIKGSQKGASTDANGNFSLEATEGDILVISYIGYFVKEVKINQESNIIINLDEESINLGEVAIVGTRGKPRTDIERPVPIDVINSKELQSTGQTELGQMAQFSSPSFNSAKYGINGVANYADPATLRGMSPDQILLLVDGKRRHQFSALNLNVTLGKGTVTTDMNSIPSLAIDRLEILRDGAAAQYGSDAIAGIINLGLNKSVEKGTFKTQLGQNKSGDGTTYLAALNYGFKLGKEGSYLNATLNYNQAKGTQRSDPYTGRIYFAAAQPIAREDSMRTAKGVWPASTSGKPFTVSTYGSNPLKAIQTFVNIGYPLNNSWFLYAFGGTSKKDIKAEGFFRNAIPSDANSNISIFPNGYDPDLPGTSNDISGVIGINRKLEKGWNIDLSTSFGRNFLDLNAKNTTNPSLGANSPTDFYVGRSNFRQSTTEVNLSKALIIKGIKSFNFAIGSQYRIDLFDVTRGDENSYKEGPVTGKASGSSGRPGIAPADESNANRSNIGVYADLESDITNNFLMAGAIRFENYSDFGNNISGKIASRFKFTKGLAIRGSINKGFRAPSLQQIFNAVTTSTVQAGAIRQTKQLPSNDPRLKKLGIEDPKAETSLNYNLGLTAKLGESLLLTVDAYQIDISDRIIISEALTTTAVPAVKALFTGTPIQEISFFTNHINTKTKGIDFVTIFKHNFNEQNRLTATASFTFNKTEIADVKATPSALTAGAANPKAILIIDTISRSLIETSQPRQKILFSLGYQYKKLNLNLRANHFGQVIAWEKPTGAFHRNQTFGAKTIFDAALTYALNKNLSLSLGANNFTDVYPDKVFSNYASYFSGQTPYTRNANQFGFNGAYYFLMGTLNF